MEGIDQLARSDSKKISGVALLTRSELTGGDRDLRQRFRGKDSVGTRHGHDFDFSTHTDTHFLANGKPQSQSPQKAVKTGTGQHGDDRREQQGHDKIFAQRGKVYLAGFGDEPRTNKRASKAVGG